MPGRTRPKAPPAPTRTQSETNAAKRPLADTTNQPAASPEPMTPRSSDDEADRPRFVAPADRKKKDKTSAKPRPRAR